MITDQQTIGVHSHIAASLRGLPDRSVELASELDLIMDDTTHQLIGSVITSLTKKRRSWLGRAIENNDTLASARRLRGDRGYRKQLKRTIEHMARRLENQIYAMQSRAYKESLAAIAGAWNTETPKGISFSFKVDKAALNQLKAVMIEGMTIKETIDDLVRNLEKRILARSMVYFSRPTGDQDGTQLLTRRIRGLLDKLARDLKFTAAAAINMANRQAFDDENNLFGDGG